MRVKDMCDGSRPISAYAAGLIDYVAELQERIAEIRECEKCGWLGAEENPHDCKPDRTYGPGWPD